MILKREVRFTPADEMRMLHIYLPDWYYETEERFPVMYFFDGHNLFSDEDATFGKSWGMKEFLDRWEKPMIVVGIECSHTGNNRLTEYCPYHIKNNFFGEIFGTGNDTLHWMIEELKPMIDAEYRTWDHREATAIAGSSMGGLMALYGVARYNMWFSKAACVSSAITSCRDIMIRDIDEFEIQPDTRVYLSWGEKETSCPHGRPEYDSFAAKANRMVAKELEKNGALTCIYYQEGGTHCEADWEKQVPYFMDFLWMGR